MCTQVSRVSLGRKLLMALFVSPSVLTTLKAFYHSIPQIRFFIELIKDLFRTCKDVNLQRNVKGTVRVKSETKAEKVKEMTRKEWRLEMEEKEGNLLQKKRKLRSYHRTNKNELFRVISKRFKLQTKHSSSFRTISAHFSSSGCQNLQVWSKKILLTFDRWLWLLLTLTFFFEFSEFFF